MADRASETTNAGVTPNQMRNGVAFTAGMALFTLGAIILAGPGGGLMALGASFMAGCFVRFEP